MGRQYVHLSIDSETAKIVGKRKDSNSVLLTVYAERAINKGIKFYQGKNVVWLAEYISPEFISFE